MPRHRYRKFDFIESEDRLPSNFFSIMDIFLGLISILLIYGLDLFRMVSI